MARKQNVLFLPFLPSPPFISSPVIRNVPLYLAEHREYFRLTRNLCRRGWADFRSADLLMCLARINYWRTPRHIHPRRLCFSGSEANLSQVAARVRIQDHGECPHSPRPGTLQLSARLLSAYSWASCFCCLFWEGLYEGSSHNTVQLEGVWELKQKLKICFKKEGKKMPVAGFHWVIWHKLIVL